MICPKKFSRFFFCSEKVVFGHRLSCVQPSLTQSKIFVAKQASQCLSTWILYWSLWPFSLGFQLWPVSFLHKDIYILFFSEIKDVGSLVWRKEKMPSWYRELKDVKVNWSEEGFGNPGWKWEFSKQSFPLVCSLSSLQVLGSIKNGQADHKGGISKCEDVDSF